MRYSGKRGKVLIGVSGSDSASEVKLSQWTINMTTERFDVTQFNDPNRVRIPGLKDVSGSFRGFFNQDDDRLFQAADQDEAVPMYLYIDDTNLAGTYFYGPGYVDASLEVQVNGPVAISSNWTAGGAWGFAWDT